MGAGQSAIHCREAGLRDSRHRGSQAGVELSAPSIMTAVGAATDCCRHLYLDTKS
jgi:hypothetical protein